MPLTDSSLLFAYLGVNILTKTAQNNRAAILFNSIQNREGYYPFYYLDYLIADFNLNSLDTENARKLYSKFLKNFNGKNYIKDAWRKMAWTYLIEGKTDIYNHILSNVGTQGYADIGKDKDALLEYTTGETPNISLLKTRLLFDGSYYSKSDSLLKLIDNSSLDFDQSLEKTYRFARVNHMTNNFIEAKSFYKSVIINSELTTKYYPANSALKLGEIYENEDSTVMAFYYYDKCIKMSFDQYENSIKAKAKEGKRRVSK